MGWIDDRHDALKHLENKVCHYRLSPNPQSKKMMEEAESYARSIGSTELDIERAKK